MWLSRCRLERAAARVERSETLLAAGDDPLEDV
jgi:hypothetical protein